MSKCYTVYVPTTKEARKVKDKLVAHGVRWNIDSPVEDLGHFINVDAEFSYCFLSKGKVWVTSRWNDPDYEAITVEELFKKLEALKPKEKTITIDGKEYSESTIKNALRDYVN